MFCQTSGNSPRLRAMNMRVWDMGVWKFPLCGTSRAPHRDPPRTPLQPPRSLRTSPESPGPRKNHDRGSADSWLPGNPFRSLRNLSGTPLGPFREDGNECPERAMWRMLSGSHFVEKYTARTASFTRNKRPRNQTLQCNVSLLQRNVSACNANLLPDNQFYPVICI